MKRLIEIQQKLKAPKNQKNSFGGYNYRSCEDILEAVKPLLKKQGLALIIEDDIFAIDGRFYVKATASLFDENKDKIAETTALAREEETQKGMSASQLTGSTSSYARKYALNGLFAIDDNKDADAINTHGKEVKKVVENDVDVDIIEGLKACDTLANLVRYKDSYKDKVKDVQGFKTEYAKMYKKLEAKENK
jgi:hypothetical protein